MWKYVIATCIAVSVVSPALADITIGVSVSMTGAAAALGIPKRNAITLMPTTIAGEKVSWIVYDDATDPTIATRNARRLVLEGKVDVLFGSSTTPTCLAVAQVATETATPQIAMAPTDVPPGKDVWLFRMVQHPRLMAKAIVADMKARGFREVGFIGYADAWGEIWLKEMAPIFDAEGMKFSVIERYNRADISVVSQVLRLVTANPAAILIVGSGTPAALPQVSLIEHGYKGQIYQTNGVASRDFLRIAGTSADGTIFPVGPVLLAKQLPDSHPVRPVALKFVAQYEHMYGDGSFSAFAARIHDAWKLLEAAVPVALKKANPGTAEFRVALRDALETTTNVIGADGVFNMSPSDHYGHDTRSRVLATIKNGEFTLLSGSK